MTPFNTKYPLVKLVVLNVLAVLAYDTLRPQPARGAVEPPAVVRAVPEQTVWHAADADQDIGPGDAEPALCQHGG